MTNNPDFVDWVFFEANRAMLRIPRLWINQIRSTKESGEVRPSPEVTMCGFDPLGRVADHASETRGTYDDKTSRKNTKTSAQAINDACHQLAIATQAIVHEDRNRLVSDYQRSDGWRPKKALLNFVPVIVTTARLFILEFDPSKVSAETGEIDRKDAKLEPVEWLDYLYPIPRHLQFGGPDLPWYQLMKLPIAIVGSRHFRKFLTQLAVHHGHYT
jgi:hypothetical protein